MKVLSLSKNLYQSTPSWKLPSLKEFNIIWGVILLMIVQHRLALTLVTCRNLVQPIDLMVRLLFGHILEALLTHVVYAVEQILIFELNSIEKWTNLNFE